MMKLEVTDKGRYDFINAVGEVTKQDFLDLYKRRFKARAGSDNVYFLIDIRDHPSVLGRDGFEQILNMAEECDIQHIYMFVISNDPARPVIGSMVEAIATSHVIDIDVTFYMEPKDAQVALDKIIN